MRLKLCFFVFRCQWYFHMFTQEDELWILASIIQREEKFSRERSTSPGLLHLPFLVQAQGSPSGNLSGIHKHLWASFSAFVLTPAIKCGCKFENPSTSQFTVYIHYLTLYIAFSDCYHLMLFLNWLILTEMAQRYSSNVSLSFFKELYNAFTNVGLTLRFTFPLSPSSPLSPNPSCHCALNWVHRR